MRLSQPIDTVRVPVSSRPMVWAVVGGSQRLATSSRVSPFARRTSRIRVIIIAPPLTYLVFSFLHRRANGKGEVHRSGENMPVHSSTPPISRSNVHVDQMVEDPEGKMQQVRVNLGESPLSWLRARGHVSERLFLAGERL